MSGNCLHAHSAAIRTSDKPLRSVELVQQGPTLYAYQWPRHATIAGVPVTVMPARAEAKYLAGSKLLRHATVKRLAT